MRIAVLFCPLYIEVSQMMHDMQSKILNYFYGKAQLGCFTMLELMAHKVEIMRPFRSPVLATYGYFLVK